MLCIITEDIHMHESPVSSSSPSFPIPVNMSSRILWVYDTNKTYSLKKLKIMQCYTDLCLKKTKYEMSTIWGEEYVWICQVTRNCSLSHPHSPRIQSQEQKFTFTCGWAINMPTELFCVRHKRQDIEFSQNLLEQTTTGQLTMRWCISVTAMFQERLWSFGQD